MKKCGDCQGKMEEKEALTPDGVKYMFYSCGKCGEEIVDMNQLRDVAGRISAENKK